jgi:hypothetical protein
MTLNAILLVTICAISQPGDCRIEQVRLAPDTSTKGCHMTAQMLIASSPKFQDPAWEIKHWACGMEWKR